MVRREGMVKEVSWGLNLLNGAESAEGEVQMGKLMEE